jgi:hypothetical protein
MPDGVRLFKRAGNLNRDVENFADFHRRSAQSFSQRNAVDVFSGDVMATAFITHLVNRENVRMVQRRRRVGFLIEPNEPVTICCEFFAEDFERDLAAELVSSAK